MRHLLLFTLGTLCLSSCYQPAEDIEQSQSETNYTRKFNFSVKGAFAQDVAPMTRANDYMIADGVEMTDLWIVDYAGGSIRQEVHQIKTDDDFGQPSLNLTLGTHHVLFLASRGAEPSYKDGVVKWSKPLDTFYCDYEVTVVKTSNGNRAVTLDRVASKLVLNIEDAMPQGTTSIRMIPSVWYDGWDMISGKPVAAADYEQTFSIPSSMPGKAGSSFSSWSLSGADEWTSDITYTSYAGDVVNASVSLNDAPFVANRATIYNGSMYSNTSAAAIQLNSSWLTSYEGVY